MWPLLLAMTELPSDDLKYDFDAWLPPLTTEWWEDYQSSHHDDPLPNHDSDGHRYEIQNFKNADGTYTIRQVFCYDPKSNCYSEVEAKKRLDVKAAGKNTK